jgi:Phage tail sheath C-terminal domain/Phage tail sheath protein subtilisin-like domain
MRTIQSPGVEIRERDLSQNPVIPAGTNVFLAGFAAKGPSDEIIQLTTVSDLEQIYGVPSTPAERYFHFTARQILQDSPANLFVNRLPYGDDKGAGFGNKYGALVYPGGSITYSDALSADAYSSTHAISAGTHVLGKPKFFELTYQEYLSVLDGTAFNWSTTGGTSINSVRDFGKAGMIILNPAQTTTDAKGEGYYIALTDNTNAEPTTDHDSIYSVNTISRTVSGGTTDYTQIPSGRLYFSLSASQNAQDATNISLNLERSYYGYADSTSRKFDDVIALNVFKLRRSAYTSEVTKLDYSTQESYLGSLDYHRKIQSQTGGADVSYFIAGQAANSPNITILVNDNISNRRNDTWVDVNTGLPLKKLRVLSHSTERALLAGGSSTVFGGSSAAFADAIDALDYSDSLFPTGPYVGAAIENKNIGSLPLKIDRALTRIENDEVFPLDIIVEGGLGTVYAACSANSTSYYDDTMLTDGLISGLNKLTSSNEYDGDGSATDLRGNYTTIFSKFDTFCSQSRRDCLFIADPLRHIFVRGENTRVMSDHDKSFSQYIYAALRHNFELASTSYSCTYGNWVKVSDPYAGINVWVPFSGFAASDMANTDRDFYPWYAPAGFTRGKVRNVVTMAITPKQKERDQLYKIGVNPVAFFPNDGFTIFGQKTLQRQPSAFDRINVRRLFLYLEKATKATVKYFVFEPNTFFTRTRVINTIKPIFELAKRSEGLYEYLLVCDNRNNTPDVIDNNELIVDIYLKPVRAAEFILVNFIATRTSANFAELVSGPRL